ncbi:unnamed protein product, partial [Bubo scandiacus]
TTPSWVGVLICLRVGRLCREIWTGWSDGLRPTVGVSIRPNAGCCTSATTTPSSSTGLGRSGWRAVSQRGTCG